MEPRVIGHDSYRYRNVLLHTNDLGVLHMLMVGALERCINRCLPGPQLCHPVVDCHSDRASLMQDSDTVGGSCRLVEHHMPAYRMTSTNAFTSAAVRTLVASAKCPTSTDCATRLRRRRTQVTLKDRELNILQSKGGCTGSVSMRDCTTSWLSPRNQVHGISVHLTQDISIIYG